MGIFYLLSGGAFLIWPMPVLYAENAVPVQVSQIQEKFPDAVEKGMEFARNRRTFKAYKGQGRLFLKTQDAKSIRLAINGVSREIHLVGQLSTGAGEQREVDIHRDTQDGTNTLKVEQIVPAGSSVEICIPYPELQAGTPESAGFSSRKLQQVDRVIENDIAQGFPGAVLMVIKDGKIVKNTAYGWAKLYDGRNRLPLEKRQPMRTDTMFDLASNTKMYATVFALMKLTEEGKINPEEKIVHYLPNYTGEGRENIRIRDVLTHSAGYAPSTFFHRPSAGKFYSLQREKTMALLEKVPLTYPLGSKTIYSDTDYMLLTALLEKVTGKSLDAYVENEIYRPLGLTHTLFIPLKKGFMPSDFAATEPCGNTRSGMVSFPGVRQYTIQGEAQDEQAYYAMGGISGHAGLFSRAGDLAVLAQLILNQGGYGDYRLCSPETLTYFTKPTDRDPRFGLGWNTVYKGKRMWEFGPYASSLAVAHTGWTGTDICIDLKYDLAIILLTNRVHAPNVPGNPDTFATEDFPTCSYGSILSMVYEAFLEKKTV